jgi:hypothetical protein
MQTDVVKKEEALGGQVDLDRSGRTFLHACLTAATGKPRRASDGIFRPELLTSVRQTDGGGVPAKRVAATFQFALSAG